MLLLVEVQDCYTSTLHREVNASEQLSDVWVVMVTRERLGQVPLVRGRCTCVLYGLAE